MKRAEAIAEGLKKYTPSKPCKNGHLSERYVNGGCVECKKNKDNTTKVKEYQKGYHQKPEVKKKRKEYQQKIRDNRSPLKQAITEANLQKYRCPEAAVKWADYNLIKDFYLQRIWMDNIAKKAGFRTQYHVDHIVPLNSEKVCGLHNEFNLQVITKFNNQSKRNKFS